SRAQRFVSFSPGMCFGETAVLDGGGRTADAVADTDSTVYALPAAALASMRQADPAIAAQVYCNLALHLSERLRAAAAAWRHAAGWGPSASFALHPACWVGTVGPRAPAR